jgi:predicted transcriptional regulator
LGTSLPFKEVLNILEAEVILDKEWLRGVISTVYGSDLMSDILSFSKPNSLLLTGLINPQTIRTAEMVEIAVICFIHGKHPHKETVELATMNQIPLIGTPLSMFEACGRLYAAGLGSSNDLS